MRERVCARACVRERVRWCAGVCMRAVTRGGSAYAAAIFSNEGIDTPVAGLQPILLPGKRLSCSTQCNVLQHYINVFATQEDIGTAKPDEYVEGPWQGPAADVAAAPAWTRWRGSRRCSGA